MEISVRRVVIISLALALVAGLVGLAVPRLAPLVTNLTPRAARPTAATASSTAGPTITYLDESLGWDWRVACAPQFQTFLAQRLPGQPITAVKVTLVDDRLDRQLPFGTVYRDARAHGHCFGQQGQFTCQVAIVAGEPGPDLDAAVTLNTPYVLLDMFLARGANPDALRQTWRLATFQPLLVPAAETPRWQSSCLQLVRVR